MAKIQITDNFWEDVEPRELLFISGGSAKWK